VQASPSDVGLAEVRQEGAGVVDVDASDPSVSATRMWIMPPAWTTALVTSSLTISVAEGM
jgi:hypothetical protein